MRLELSAYQKTEIVALHDTFVKHNLDKVMGRGNINKVWGHASARGEGMGVRWGLRGGPRVGEREKWLRVGTELQ